MNYKLHLHDSYLWWSHPWCSVLFIHATVVFVLCKYEKKVSFQMHSLSKKIENIWQVVSQKQTFIIDLKRYHIIVVLVVGKLHIIRVNVLWYVYNYIELTPKKNKLIKKA